MYGFEWANGGGKAVKLVRGGRIAGMLERRTSESRAIIQALELGCEIKGRVSSLEIFQQCDSGRRVVKGKMTWGLVPDSDSLSQIVTKQGRFHMTHTYES